MKETIAGIANLDESSIMPKKRGNKRKVDRANDSSDHENRKVPVKNSNRRDDFSKKFLT